MPEPHVIQMGDIWEGWDGQWVRIKPWMSYADDQLIEAAGVQASMASAKDSAITIGVRSVEAAVAWVELQVEDWNLLDYEGQPIERSRAGIESKSTPPDLIDQAIGAISDYYEALRPPAFRKKEGGG